MTNSLVSSLKQAARQLLAHTVKVLGNTKVGSYFFELVLNNAMGNTQSITHGNIRLDLAAPNSLNRWRIKTFSTKEPETLEWIDSFQDGAVLWDIGANVGLYTCYAAARKTCTIFAFEPSVFNLEILARNVFLNSLTDKVAIVPLPLSDQLSISPMRLTTTEWGGALSTFGQNFGWNGKTIEKLFEFRTLGLSIDQAIDLLGIPLPDHIKMDVDGLEHFILKGGPKTLTKIQSILIEVNDDFDEQASNCHDLLLAAGLTLKAKRHSDLIANSTSGISNSYNQIWVRD
jgi:FkbM family methyltransferase